MFGRPKKRIEAMIKGQWGSDSRDLPTAYLSRSEKSGRNIWELPTTGDAGLP